MSLSRWPTAVVLSALFGAGAAFAATADDANNAGIDFRKSISLSPQETLAQSKDYAAKMRETEKRILGLQSRAAKDRDMVKLNCVGDKLTQVRGHMTVTDQSLQTMNAAIGKGDDNARQHEFTRVTILYQKVATLGTEAEQCIGEDVSYVGATTVDITVDPSVPPGDPTQPDLPLPVVQRPPEASPFV